MPSGEVPCTTTSIAAASCSAVDCSATTAPRVSLLASLDSKRSGTADAPADTVGGAGESARADRRRDGWVSEDRLCDLVQRACRNSVEPKANGTDTVPLRMDQPSRPGLARTHAHDPCNQHACTSAHACKRTHAHARTRTTAAALVNTSLSCARTHSPHEVIADSDAVRLELHGAARRGKVQRLSLHHKHHLSANELSAVSTRVPESTRVPVSTRVLMSTGVPVSTRAPVSTRVPEHP